MAYDLADQTFDPPFARLLASSNSFQLLLHPLDQRPELVVG